MQPKKADFRFSNLFFSLPKAATKRIFFSIPFRSTVIAAAGPNTQHLALDNIASVKKSTRTNDIKNTHLVGQTNRRDS